MTPEPGSWPACCWLEGVRPPSPLPGLLLPSLTGLELSAELNTNIFYKLTRYFVQFRKNIFKE